VARVFVAPVSFGLGDLVVSLPAVQALISAAAPAGDEVWLVARSPAQAQLAGRIAGLAGCVADDAFDRDPGAGRFVDLRDHPLQRDHWWGSPEFEAEYGKLTINAILARICADFAIDADFARPAPLASHPRTGLGASVLLVAETDGPSKRWPDDHWRAVVAAVAALGLDARVVTRGSADDRTAAFGVAAAPAPTPGDAVDVLTAARAVVGVDTGLTHIAAQQGTPTVTICRANDVYFRPWEHTRAVRGSPCDDRCVAEEQAYAYSDRVDLRGFDWEPLHCPVDGRCLDAARPEAVVRALEEVL
jgi:hypothetical protein